MPSTFDLLASLEAAGLSLALTKGNPADELRVTPASKLTPELRQIIREHKPELLHHLSRVAPDGSTARVTSVRGEEPGRAGCVVWEVEVTPEQPVLPLEPEKRGSHAQHHGHSLRSHSLRDSQKPFKAPPTFPKGKDTLESPDGRLA